LTLAATEGRIQLALRNTLDSDEIETRGRRIASLITAAPSPRAVASTPRPAPQANPERVIESFEGGSRTLLKFGPGGDR
jgi:Flp pilus assembly protein CpaB